MLGSCFSSSCSDEDICATSESNVRFLVDIKRKNPVIPIRFPENVVCSETIASSKQTNEKVEEL